MLMDSIGIVLHDFFDMLDSTPIYEEWKSIGFDNSEEDVESFFGLKPYVTAKSLIVDISKTNKYQIVRNAIPELFQAEKELTLWDDSERIDTHAIGVPNSVFTRLLFIIACLRHDVQAEGRASSQKLKEKTCIILENIRDIFGSKDSVGAFLIVKNRKDDRTVVYDRNTEGCHILTDSFLADKSKGSFLQVFLDYDSAPRKIEAVNIHGDNEDFRTIIELVPGTKNKWKGRYSSKEAFDLPAFSEYKWMYVLRLESLNRKRETKEIAPMGILCVYGNNKKDVENDLGRKLLLLMRRDLSSFVHFHHRNDEFIDLIVAERTQRFAYLAGHGRVVMQDLTEYKNREKGLSEDEEIENEETRKAFRTVVRTMERMQYLFAMDKIDLDASREKNLEVIRNNFQIAPLSDDIMERVDKDVSRMARAIYESDIVEIQEPVHYTQSIARGLSKIEFSKEILLMIIFELIWNAKKNRFHLVRNLCGVINQDENFMNSLDIKISTVKKQVNKIDRTALVLTVSGSGPTISPGIVNKIKYGVQLKPDEMNSGLEMIQKTLSVMDKANNLTIVPGALINSVSTNTVIVEIYV